MWQRAAYWAGNLALTAAAAVVTRLVFPYLALAWYAVLGLATGVVYATASRRAGWPSRPFWDARQRR